MLRRGIATILLSLVLALAAPQAPAAARRGVEVAEGLVRAAAEARELAERTDALTRRSFEIGQASSLELVQTAEP